MTFVPPPGYAGDPRERLLLEQAKRLGITPQQLQERLQKAEHPEIDPYPIATNAPKQPATMAKSQAAAEVHNEAVQPPAPIEDPWERARKQRGAGGVVVLPGGMQRAFEQTEHQQGVPVSKEAKQAFDASQSLADQAIQLEAKTGQDISAQSSEAQRQLGQEGELFRAEQAARDTSHKAVLRQHREALDSMQNDIRNNKIDPERVWHNRGWLMNIVGGILGHVLRRKGDANWYLEELKNETDRDVEAQKAEAKKLEGAYEKSTNLYSTMYQTFKDDDAAATAMHIVKIEALQQKLKQVAATSAGEQAKINAVKATALLERDKQEQYDKWGQMMAGKTVETVKDVNVPPKVVGVGGGSKEVNVEGLGPEPTNEQVSAYGDDYFKLKLADNDVVIEQLAVAAGGKSFGDAIARKIALGADSGYGEAVEAIKSKVAQMQSDPKALAAYNEAARSVLHEAGSALTNNERQLADKRLGSGSVQGMTSAIDAMTRTGRIKRRYLIGKHGKGAAVRFWVRSGNAEQLPVELSEPKTPSIEGGPPGNPNPEGGPSAVTSKRAGVGLSGRAGDMTEKIRKAKEAEKARAGGKAR